MQTRETQFNLLSDEAEALILNLEKCNDPEQRVQSLRKLKGLLDEIDALTVVSMDGDFGQASHRTSQDSFTVEA
jgi:hypothetical protein